MSDTQPPTLPPADDGAGALPPPGAPPIAPAPIRSGPPVRVVSAWVRIPAMIVVGLILVAFGSMGVLAAVPSETLVEKQNPRLGVEQPAPFARVPATATPVDDRIVIGDIEDVEQFPPAGDIYFVTISEPEQSVLSWLIGRDDAAIQFLTNEDKFGFQTAEQRRTLALESMRTSEQVAQFVALDRLGFDVDIVPGDVLIQQMVCLEPNAEGTDCAVWSPSDDVLDPGDRILEADGAAVDTVEDLGEVLAGKQPGDLVPMTIERPEVGELDVDVELTVSPDDPERTIVGFYPFDTAAVELPFELDIDTGSIGGPSAGLAFTLTLIDDLSEGELTGGRDVAVTGSIGLDGSVGPIGGLRQKVSAVMQNGVDVFIVPASQSDADLDAAREVAGDQVEIIPVDDLDGALAALESLGGDPIGD